jgi:Protein of unknown function (DUF1703)./Predicted AAA-ATPase.
MDKPKKIPYALTNFESIRTENYLYVDKTRFIEMLENENSKYHFLIRPRKFGKSLFLSVLEHYYDLRFKDRFQELFDDLYIGQNPTEKANSYFVMNFDFSGLDSSDVESFKISFTETIRNNMEMFFIQHDNIFTDVDDLIRQLAERNTVGAYIEFAFGMVKKHGQKAFVIIDEYDHFANDVIAKGCPSPALPNRERANQYQESIWANSITRDFYETLKKASKTVVDKIFVTGITPIMLDDLTSGFNISNNISLQSEYNEILGLTRDEVEWVMEQIQLDKSLITVDLEQMYDGYLFNEYAENKLFNSTMILYYFLELKRSGKKIKYFIDDNLKTDYGKLRNLINKHDNKQKIRDLAENNSVPGNVIKQFSMELIHEDKNFFSLLFYMGLVTIDNSNPLKLALKIPNYSVKTMHWAFIERMLTEELKDISMDGSKYADAIYSLAYEGDYRPFFKYFSKYVVQYLSNRDLINTVEKDIKFLLFPIFLSNDYYFPISELENSEGYTDIYLKRGNLHPGSLSEWIFEIKYVKQCDAENKKLIKEQQAVAEAQLLRYKNSNLFKDRTDVRYIAAVFVGKKDYYITEV